MAEEEQTILDAGAQIVWVLEADPAQEPGTMETCVEVMGELGATQGWCVGDGQTMPTPGVFDNSPFSVDRGFDMVVTVEAMEILWVSSHGSPSGNDNLDANDVVDAVQAAVE